MLFVLFYTESVYVHSLDCPLDEAFVTGAVRCDILMANTAGDLVLEVAERTARSVPDAFSNTLFHSCATFPGRVVLEPQTPSLSRGASLDDKVRALVDCAGANGWDIADHGQSLEFSRGAEFISAVFEGNAWDAMTSVWVNLGRTLRLPNLNAALSRLTGRPEDVPPPGRPGRRAGAVKRATEPYMPFDLTDDDEVIMLSCIGRELVWLNSFSGEEERAYIAPTEYREAVVKGRKVQQKVTNRHTRVHKNGAGRRMITFVEHGGGFRTVALDSLVAVR
jgi:hypothetical protein